MQNVLINYDDLVSDLVDQLLSSAYYLDPPSLADIQDACEFGIRAHHGQVRQSGEPYITHPISVAKILTELRVSKSILIAAVLHDTIEDTGVNQKDIKNLFGNEVLHLVEGVTKISKLHVKDKLQAEADSLRKMLLAMSKDIGVILIKLADRIHNMHTLESLRQDKQVRIAKQTLDIFAPLAQRLGLLFWQHKLEDISFQILYPKRYKAIAKKLSDNASHKATIINKVHSQINKKLFRCGIKHNLYDRPTNIYGIYQRMHNEHLSFADIQEIIGIVIVVESLDDCYRTLGQIHDIFKPVPNKMKDYIAIAKINGYQSLHTTVFGPFSEALQVIIRTEEMHIIAEYGVTAHRQNLSKEEINNANQWLVDFLDAQKQTSNAEEFIDHLKSDLFPKEVFIFTPKGDIKRLPKSATALDFAYSVHSDIGNHCSGAIVNGETVSLYQTLHNGDNVKILTNENAQPQPAWLDYAKTARARAVIRTSLRHRSQEDAYMLGKQLMQHSLTLLNISKISSEIKTKLLQAFNKEKWRDLLKSLGHGHIAPAELYDKLQQIKIVVSGNETDSNDADSANQVEDFVFNGIKNINIDFALCCHPIPGDSIIGYVRQGKGLKIHQQNCTVLDEANRNQMLSVNWPNTFSRPLPVPLMITTQNRPGVLAALATTIASHGANISSVNVKDKDGRLSNIIFEIEVESRQQLSKIMRVIRMQDGINKVSRV